MLRIRESAAHAVRFFRRDRAIALTASAILALGLGANLAVFAVAYAVLLRPLPMQDQRSLAIMWERAPGQATSVWEVSYRDFRDWETRNASFTRIAAIGSVNWSARLMQHDGPVVLPFAAVSGTFFETLGAQPVLGRALASADDSLSHPAVAVISDATWRQQFNADPGVVGRTVTIDDGGGMRPTTVIGIMPPDFDYPRGAALWLPIAPTLDRLSAAAGFNMLEARDLGILYVVGRLRNGVTPASARADMNTIVGSLTGAAQPGTARSIVLTPLEEYIFGQVRPALRLLIAAAALVLVLACANVVGLLMARLSSRRRELAVQIALGAARRDLMRQALAEGAGLALVGMAAAFAAAAWCVPLLTALTPDTVPRLNEVTLRGSMPLRFALAAAAAAAVACGACPLLMVLRRGVESSLLASGEISARHTLRVRNLLLAVQTALAVLLLVGAVLTARSFSAIRHIQLGFEPDALLTFDVLAPPGKYGKDENNRFYRLALDRVRGLPGVASVAAVYLRPFEFGAIGSGAAVLLEGQPPGDRAAWRKNPTLNAEAVTPGYFAALRIPVVQGRGFTDHDTAQSPPVVVISQSAARRLWPGENPIGKRLMASYDRPAHDWQTVVGVVGDVQYRGLTESSYDLYKPYLQSEDAVKHFVIRAGDHNLAVPGRLREEIHAVDSQAVVDAIRPLQDAVDRQWAPWRFAALLFSVLAALALVVAVAGVYALLAQHIAERRHEIGIRMALGARPAQIVRFFAVRTSRVLGAGLFAGVAIALLAARGMTALLFGVTARDGWTYAAACVVLMAAAAAGAFPAIRSAATMDPMRALKRE
jgi:predicted permease